MAAGVRMLPVVGKLLLKKKKKKIQVEVEELCPGPADEPGER